MTYGKIKARFVWADGYVDSRHIYDHAVWRRFAWDREDVPLDRRYALLNGCLNFPSADGALPDIVEFERISLDDGSFEYRERSAWAIRQGQALARMYRDETPEPDDIPEPFI